MRVGYGYETSFLRSSRHITSVIKYSIGINLMAVHCFHQRGLLSSQSLFPLDVVGNWEDVVCPICLDYPHNSVLLLCASSCRAFVCDTDQLHSNCLERFKIAYGILPSKSLECTSSSFDAADALLEVRSSVVLLSGKSAACPLCRGEVIGWVIMEKSRDYFNQKTRCCEEERCGFTGTYTDLREHAQLQHPNSHPSRIDPVRRVEWENFQESSNMIDILSTIQSEVPRGVVLGDYVIEYDGGDGDDDDNRDEFEDVSGDDEGNNWWTSCIWHHVFDNLRNRRRSSRAASRERRRGNSHSSYYGATNSDDGSVTSVEYLEDRVEDLANDVYVNPTDIFPRTNSGH